MNEQQATDAIEQFWLDNWPVQQPAVPFTFGNEVFESVETWCRLTIVSSTGKQTTMGAPGTRKFERRGNIVVQLFGSIGIGDQQLATLADSVRTVLESARIGVQYSPPVLTYEGVSRPGPSDGRWAMRMVVVPYLFIETR